MDWPLSREEKKSQLLRFYHNDVRIADSLIVSGEATLVALHKELDEIRRTTTTSQLLEGSAVQPEAPSAQEQETARLRQAVESATAVLRALLPTQEAACDDGASCDEAGSNQIGPVKVRARSEGAAPQYGSSTPTKPALCRTPRSRDGKRRERRVSFHGDSTTEADDNDEAYQTPRRHGDAAKKHSSSTMRRRHSGPACGSQTTSSQQTQPHDAYVLPAGFAGISEMWGRWWGTELESRNSSEKSEQVSPHTATPPSSRRRYCSPEPQTEPGPEPEASESKSAAKESYSVIATAEVSHLGLSFRGTVPEPVVVTRIAAESWALTQGIVAGDELDAVNSVRLQGITDEVFCAMMKARPLTLTFARVTGKE